MLAPEIVRHDRLLPTPTQLGCYAARFYAVDSSIAADGDFAAILVLH